MLFEPLGMTSSSFDFADLEKRKNRAAMHTKVDETWVPNLEADYDPQAPAGSASSSLRDMAAWVTMLLAEGKPVMDARTAAADLEARHREARLSRRSGRRPSFYGLGWNVNYEPTGELRVSHSGAFGRGAATTVTLYPSKGLAFVGLTNGPPVGLPEAIGVEFADHVRYGKSTQEDWVAVIGPYITAARDRGPEEVLGAGEGPDARRGPRPRTRVAISTTSTVRSPSRVATASWSSRWDRRWRSSRCATTAVTTSSSRPPARTTPASRGRRSRCRGTRRRRC